MILVMRIMILRRNGEIHQDEHREYQRLDHAHEHFEKNEWHRQPVRQNRSHRKQEDFSSKDIAEETERERGDLREFSDELKDADKERDRRNEEYCRIAPYLARNAPERLQINIFVENFPHADRHDAEDVGADHCDQRECERRIDIGRTGPQERHECRTAVSGMCQDAECAQWQDAEPVIDEHEEKNTDSERKDFLRNLAIAGDLVGNAECAVNDDLEKILEPARDFFQVLAERDRDEHDDEDHDPTREQRVGNGESVHLRQRFGIERDFMRDLSIILYRLIFHRYSS